MPGLAGQLVTETLAYDGGRQVTVYIPPGTAEAVVFVADGGWHTSRLSEVLEAAGAPPTMIVGVHGLEDDEGRLKEYVLVVDPQRFAEHEEFFVERVPAWVRSRFGVALGVECTAVWGASLGAELSLALGVRHLDRYSAVFAASPGAGFRPPAVMPSPLPRVYLVAGDQEPFFLKNAIRWADALGGTGAEVVMTEREGDHGGAFWYEEFPVMVAWAFGK
jgi:enterochelin esterase-like enzyme